MLVAHKGEFLLVDKNIGTIGFSEPFSAIGSGWCEARGAMWAHNLVVGKLADADAIACMGVEAAIALDSGCGPPFCL
jgi:ATP-dependent protease HslVU (ClpYQ) peptidase subunit